jgi:hypothetical protein
MPLNIPKTAEALEEALQTLMHANRDEFDDYVADTLHGVAAPKLEHLATFSDVGVLTRDRGLVLRLSDGSEYLLTISQSK